MVFHNSGCSLWSVAKQIRNQFEVLHAIGIVVDATVLTVDEMISKKRQGRSDCHKNNVVSTREENEIIGDTPCS